MSNEQPSLYARYRSSIEQVFRSLISRKSIIIASVIGVLLLLLLLPELYFILLLDKKEMKRSFRTYIRKHHAYISFDDIALSFYRGLVIYNAEIAAEEVLTKGKPVFKARRIILAFDRLAMLKEKKLQFSSIKASDGRWFISVNHDLESDNLTPLIGDWSGSLRELNIFIPDSELNLVFKRKNYLKKEITIENADIVINKGAATVEVSAEFQNRSLGSHRYSHEIKFCREKKCDSQYTHHSSWSFKGLPASFFSWWSDRNNFRSNATSGFLEIEKNNNKLRFQGPLQVADFSLFNEKKQKYFSAKSIRAKIAWQKIKHDIQSEVSGEFDKNAFNLKVHSDDDSDWPEQMNFVVTPSDESAEINVFNDVLIRGTKRLSVDVKKYKSRYDGYRDISVEYLVKNGNINYRDISLDLPLAEFSIADEKANLVVDLKRNNSDLHFEHRGKVENRKKKYRPVIDPFEDSYDSISKIKIIVFRITGHGILRSNNLNYADFQHLYQPLIKKMNQLTSKRLKNDRFKPRLLGRQWFHEYFREAYADYKVDFNRVQLFNTSFNQLAGELKIAIPKLTLELEDAEKNSADLTWYYGASNPWLTINIDASLKGPRLERNWFVNEKLVKSFAIARARYHYKAYGEYLSDLYRTAKVSLKFSAQDATLGDAFQYERVQNEWNELRLELERNGRSGKIKSMTGISNSAQLSVEGNFSDRQLQPVFKLKATETKN